MQSGQNPKSPSRSLIHEMFASKALSVKPKCPLCGIPATEREVNNHLDEGCPEQVKETNVAVEMASKVSEEDLFQDSDSEYVKADLDANDDENIFTPQEFCFVASQQISNTPNKFGGTDNLTSTGQVKFKDRTPKKPRYNSPFRHKTNSGGKPDPSPQNSDGSTLKRNLFTPEESNEENNVHVPLSQSKRQDPNHVPYYLRNFETIVRGVIEETDDVQLFDEEDLKVVETFRGLNLDARRLYVRLFQRKFAWIQTSSISYDEVHDKNEALKTLVEKSLIIDNTKLTDLETVLKLLSAPTIKKLCKDMNLSVKGNQKSDGVEALMNHSKKKSFFAKSSTADVILKKARCLIDACYMIAEEPRKIFLRIFSLYSLSNWWDERENSKGQPVQLTTILLQNTGQVTFPVTDIIRKTKIFRCKNDLLIFEKSVSFESRMSEIFDTKDFENGIPICEESRQFFEQILNDADLEMHVKSLPKFLRRYSAGSVTAYVLTKCVEVYERLKQHRDAVELLKLLLSQDLYLPDYHGHWYDRLTLDLEGHLKQPDLALEAIESGIRDVNVQVARKLTLCQRVLKICSMKKNGALSEKYLSRFQSSQHWLSPMESPVQIIQGRLLPKENQLGTKTVFIYESFESSDDGAPQRTHVLCSVEDLVKLHYKDHLSLFEGLHGEGSVVNTICGLIFWDIIYDLPVADAFRSPHQAYPLDFDTDDFYVNRRDEIDQRLEDIETWSEDYLNEMVTMRWQKYHDVTASMCNWDLFRGPEHLCGLLGCLKLKQWRAICDRLIKNHRHTRSGFPDLTLWNPELKQCRFVEVKGPNDRLSAKQILWLEFLNEQGIDAVVCHVEAVNAKKLKTSAKKSPQKLSPYKEVNVRKRSNPKKSEKSSNDRGKRNSRHKRARLNSENDFVN